MRLLALFVALIALTASAQTPTPSLAKEFATPFGPLTVTDDQGNALLTRTQADVDAGVDWRPGGKLVPLDTEHDTVTIVPVAARNGAFYVVTILFHAADGRFLSEVPLLADTQKTEPQTCAGLAKLAATKAPGAANYALRFRIQPVGKAGAAFAFGAITASPTAP